MRKLCQEQQEQHRQDNERRPGTALHRGPRLQHALYQEGKSGHHSDLFAERLTPHVKKTRKKE